MFSLINLRRIAATVLIISCGVGLLMIANIAITKAQAQNTQVGHGKVGIETADNKGRAFGDPIGSICAPAHVGLVSWWFGDGNALDSRSRNNGALIGDTGFATGKVGQAFNLDGNGDSVQIPHNENLNIDGSYSAETWIFPRSIPTNNVRILEKDPWNMVLRTSPANALNVNINNGGAVTLANAVPLNQWSHVAFTLNGATGLVRIFINGTLAASGTTPTPTTTGSIQPLFIGNNNGTNGFDGLIDEPGVYNRILTDAEIVAVANAGTAGKCKPTATTAPANLVGWWGGDGDANDISASSRHGALQNGTAFAVGKVGQAFSFDGVDDHITFSGVPTTATDNWTMEAWINPANLAQQSMVMSNGYDDGGGGNGYAFGIGNGCNDTNACAPGNRLQGLLSGVAFVDGGFDFPSANQWYHVVMLRDSGTVKFYVDGVQTPSTSTIAPNTPTEFRLGSQNGIRFFNGQVDEASIYNRVLLLPEIQSIVNAGLAGKLKQNATVDTNSISSLWQGEGNADDTRGLNNGSFSANTYAAGRVGQTFSLDGADDSVNFGSMPPLQNFSLEAWVRPQSVVSDSLNQELIVGQASFGAQIVVRPGTNGGMRVVVQYRDTANSFAQLMSTVDIPLTSWSHLNGTFDGTTLKLYIDGLLNAQTNPANTTVQTCNTPYFIGGFPPNTDCNAVTNPAFQFFNGLIDEAAVYNRALTAAEIQANHQAGNALSTVVGDARITFGSVTTSGTTQQIPLEAADMPPLPAGMAHTGLLYDIATSAVTSGNVSVCFNLPAFAGLTQAEFFERRILHLEAGVWVNRTSGYNFVGKVVCANSPSLSPFAIVDSNLAPTAATVNVGGRVTTTNGVGIRNAVVTLTEANGRTHLVGTSSFGYYEITDIASGQSVFIEVGSKRYQFAPRVVMLSDDLTGVDFSPIE